MAMVNFVKFIRGTKTNWDKTADNAKDSNTLYFISNEDDATDNKLYLGSKLISCGMKGTVSGNLSDLNDILISENLTGNSILVYDATENKWVNKTVNDVLSLIVTVMTGASAEEDGAAGLVPQPKAGDQEKFLQGDGTWVDITEKVTTIAAEEVAKIVDGAPEAYDTLKEIAEWIAAHDTTTDIITTVKNLDSTVNGTEANNYEDGLANRVTIIENALTWQELPEPATTE